MRVIRLLSLLLLIAVVSNGHANAQDEDKSNYPDRKALIVNNCPHVELSNFIFANRYGSGSTRFSQGMKWKNIGKQPLIAFEIVILNYDAFNRRMIGTRWTVTGRNSADWKPLEPGMSNGDGSSGFGVEEVFTGIAYVRLARFKDGTIWRANDAKLLEQLRKVAPEIEEFGDVKPDPSPRQTESCCAASAQHQYGLHLSTDRIANDVRKRNGICD